MLDGLLVGQHLLQQDVDCANLAVFQLERSQGMVLQTIDELRGLNLLDTAFRMSSVQSRRHQRTLRKLRIT